MKRISILLGILILSMSGLFALEVNEPELQKIKEMDSVEFLSYTGPHKVIDSAEAIRNIGAGLGIVVNKTPEDFVNTGNPGKYYVIHAVDSAESGKLDADILFLGNNAYVDHIKNLRRIIGTYLEKAYGYSRKDADTLAVFVTVYNAVYRGKLTELQNIYKSVVINNLSEDKCGLSTNYKDWPGKSQIIIPLRNIKDGGLSTVDTTVISDTKVVESMKEDEGKGIDNRKEMVDLKEREADEASEKAKDSQKTAAEEQKKLNDEIKKTEEVKKEAAEAEKEAKDKKKDVEEKKQVAEEKKQIAEENPEDKTAQDEAEKAEEEVKKAEEEAEKAEEKAEEKKEEVKEQEKKEEEQAEKTQEAKEQAKEHQEFSDKKQTEAQSDRKEIAKDQGIIIKEEIAKAPIETEHGLVIADKTEMLSKIVKFNTENGEIVKNSPVTVIRNRTMYKAGESYIAIAGKDSGNSTVKLVLIDGETLELTAESDISIASDSVLVQDGDSYYCVTEENGKNYVAKFGEDLSLKLKSDVEVLSCTPVTFTNSGIVVTGISGTIKILRKSDLKEINTPETNTSIIIAPGKIGNVSNDGVIPAEDSISSDLPEIEEATVVDVAPVVDLTAVEAVPVTEEEPEDISSDLFAK